MRAIFQKKMKKKDACARTWTESTHVVQIARPAAQGLFVGWCWCWFFVRRKYY